MSEEIWVSILRFSLLCSQNYGDRRKQRRTHTPLLLARKKYKVFPFLLTGTCHTDLIWFKEWPENTVDTCKIQWEVRNLCHSVWGSYLQQTEGDLCVIPTWKPEILFLVPMCCMNSCPNPVLSPKDLVLRHQVLRINSTQRRHRFLENLFLSN